MGFGLTLFYLFTNLMTPAEIVPALLPYRIMLVLLLVTLLFSAFTMLGNRFSFTAPQLVLVLLLVGDGALTTYYADRWLTSGINAILDLLFLAGITLMVCWNVISLNRLRILALVLALTGSVVVVDSLVALETGYRAETFLLHEKVDTDTTGKTFINRIQGLGVLSDPNDLGQFLLVGVAMLGCCWKRRRFVSNLLLVYVPAALLLYGVLLTRSRGAVLGLLVLVCLLLQKRLGKFGVFVGIGVAVAGIAAMTALAGRDLSLQEGSTAGRLDAWYAGLQMFKGSPVLGVGFQHFTEHHDLTAHNSYMLCLAELGFPGFFVWLALLVSSLFQTRAVSFLQEGNEAFDDLRQCGRSVFNALVMFMVTAWFLSRSYTTVFFVLIGCSLALTELARNMGAPLEIRKQPWKMATLVASVSAVFVAYVTIRLRGVG